MEKMEAWIRPVPVKIRQMHWLLDQTTWPVRVNRVVGGGEHRLSAKDRSSLVVAIGALCGRIYLFPRHDLSAGRRPADFGPRAGRS
jgi:hypothetical protein